MTRTFDYGYTKVRDLYAVGQRSRASGKATIAAIQAANPIMLEPIMMVFMGGSIGSILIAMYLPIFTIADAVK